MSIMKEQWSGASGKGTDLSELSTSHKACGSSSDPKVELNRDKNESGVLSPIPEARAHEPQGNNHNRMLKLDFPKFNGENPRLWLGKCTRYFTCNKMNDFNKLRLVTMSLEDVVDNWFVDYMDDKPNLTLEEFTRLVLNRFLNPNGGSLLAQFNKMRQTGSVQSYIQEFKEMRSLMKESNKVLTDEYFMDSFVGGLKEKINKFVVMQKPITLLSATQ